MMDTPEPGLRGLRRVQFGGPAGDPGSNPRQRGVKGDICPPEERSSRVPRRQDARSTQRIAAALSVVAVAAALTVSAGCEVNSFFDPSRTGRFTTAPTTMPILTRIDAIEPGTDLWGQTTSVAVRP